MLEFLPDFQTLLRYTLPIVVYLAVAACVLAVVLIAHESHSMTKRLARHNTSEFTQVCWVVFDHSIVHVFKNGKRIAVIRSTGKNALQLEEAYLKVQIRHGRVHSVLKQWVVGIKRLFNRK